MICKWNRSYEPLIFLWPLTLIDWRLSMLAHVITFLDRTTKFSHEIQDMLSAWYYKIWSYLIGQCKIAGFAVPLSSQSKFFQNPAKQVKNTIFRLFQALRTFRVFRITRKQTHKKFMSLLWTLTFENCFSNIK